MTPFKDYHLYLGQEFIADKINRHKLIGIERIVNNAVAYTGRKHDLVLVVLHKEKRFKMRKQAFDFDVFRALVYQK